jgi:hypothetical protein
MRVKAVVFVAALAACSSSTRSGGPAPTPTGGSGGTTPTGGSSGSGGTTSGGSGGGETPPSTGGSSGSGGSPTKPDAASAPAIDAAMGGAVDGGSAPPVTGGTVLYLAGDKPLVGNDGLIHDALKAKGLTVQDVTTATITPAMAEGKRLMIVSYSIQSDDFKGAMYADVKVPMIVLEHNVLPDLGLTDGAGHGFAGGSTLTISGTDAELTAGLTGDVTVYGPAGKEMFWGVPGPGAIKVASQKGTPGHYVEFAYPAGAMMAAKPAPAKRMLLFIASHAPPPVNEQFLNADGTKLLNAALDWMLK